MQLGWLRNTTPQSVVASKVDLVGFLQCKQFVVQFSLQCRSRVSFKYFVGLFVVNKRVHFVVVVCLVHDNSHPAASMFERILLILRIKNRPISLVLAILST